MGRMGYMGIVWGVCSLVGAVGSGGALWMAFRIWKRRRAASLAMTLFTLLLAATALFGGLGTLVGLVMAFTALDGESVDPSQKARRLAEGISQAMNCAALGLLAGVAMVLVAVVAPRFRKTR